DFSLKVMEDIYLPIVADGHREASWPQFSQLAENTTHRELPCQLCDHKVASAVCSTAAAAQRPSPRSARRQRHAMSAVLMCDLHHGEAGGILQVNCRYCMVFPPCAAPYLLHTGSGLAQAHRRASWLSWCEPADRITTAEALLWRLKQRQRLDQRQ